MTVLTSNRDEAEVALEDRVRALLATGLSADAVAGSMRDDGFSGDGDALWLYSWVIAGHCRGGVMPRPDLPSLD
jgi:hypothetical protein